jgi:uncharacterized membrane protein
VTEASAFDRPRPAFVGFSLPFTLAFAPFGAALFAGRLALSAPFFAFRSAGFREGATFAFPFALEADTFAPLRLLVFFGISFPFVRS